MMYCVRRDERQKYQQGKPQYSVVEDKWTGYYLERKCQNISISYSARIKVRPLDFFLCISIQYVTSFFKKPILVLDVCAES